ncbi:hypothetical protein J2S30_002301 [Herbaspirillum rubrisubalbicans]|nr:hypothetical protein [Herbaspirillum rubrisubalbicans]
MPFRKQQGKNSMCMLRLTQTEGKEMYVNRSSNPYGYSSGSDDESKKQISSPPAESSSSYQPSSRIPDRNRRVMFQLPEPGPTEPTLTRSVEHTSFERFERVPDFAEKRAQKNREAAAKLVAMRTSDSKSERKIAKDCIKQGTIPFIIRNEYNVSRDEDIADVLQRYEDTRKNR